MPMTATTGRSRFGFNEASMASASCRGTAGVSAADTDAGRLKTQPPKPAMDRATRAIPPQMT